MPYATGRGHGKRAIMGCQACGHAVTGVVDCETTSSGQIRRRRKCLRCNVRFTTFEVRRGDETPPSPEDLGEMARLKGIVRRALGVLEEVDG